MKSVWKFTLEVTDRQVLVMPKNAEILTAQMQGTYLRLWALVDLENSSREPRVIEILPTGSDAEDTPRRYIATVQMDGGALIWHIFEKL